MRGNQSKNMPQDDNLFITTFRTKSRSSMRGSDPPEIHDSELITTEKKMAKGRGRSMTKSASLIYATKKSS